MANESRIVVSFDMGELAALQAAIFFLTSKSKRLSVATQVTRAITRALSSQFRTYLSGMSSRGFNFTENNTYRSFAGNIATSTRQVRLRGGEYGVASKIGIGRKAHTGTWSQSNIYIDGKGPFTFRRTKIVPSKYWHLVARGTKSHYQPMLGVKHPGTKGPDIRGNFIQSVSPKVRAIARQELFKWLRKNDPILYKIVYAPLIVRAGYVP